jgi:hypothetical protein
LLFLSFKKTAKSKQSPKSKKFAQFGHPAQLKKSDVKTTYPSATSVTGLGEIPPFGKKLSKPSFLKHLRLLFPEL